MRIAIKRLERAISDLPKGGMQTGSHKVKLDLADAERLIAEIKALKAERNALAAQVDALKNHLSSFGKTETLEDAVKWEDGISALIKATPQHHLAAHDAEVAKAAFIAGWIDRATCRFFNRDDAVSNYLEMLRAKLGE